MVPIAITTTITTITITPVWVLLLFSALYHQRLSNYNVGSLVYYLSEIKFLMN